MARHPRSKRGNMSSTAPGSTPVLVGCGQVTDRLPADQAGSPLDLMERAAGRAAADAGPGDALWSAIDAVAVPGLTVDSASIANMEALRTYRNVPDSLSRRLGAQPVERYYTHVGGNTPQMFVNHYAERIAEGAVSAVLLAGAEALHTMQALLSAGDDLSAWREDEGDPPVYFKPDRAPATPHEEAHGLDLPAHVYPLFENALRGAYGLSLEAHRRRMGRLFQRFSTVAAGNPLAWYPTARTAEELTEPGPANRYVAFPYTKYLNAAIRVNMGAAVIMTSLEKARALGVPDDRLVYLHGCADADDIWHVAERADLHSSPALRLAGRTALQMAGRSIDAIDVFDLYSCFPCAVQIACDAFGIDVDDPRDLTVTGGLPYFGGPGNNYSMHAIAAMMDRLRAQPGSFGMLNANGWYVTKHSVGVYSTTPTAGPWRRTAPSALQARIEAGERARFTETPEGRATVETYTVVFDRDGPLRGVVVGRLADGTRFLAQPTGDPETLRRWVETDMLGAPGVVRAGEINQFEPDG